MRCAKCRHSWYQEGPSITRPAQAPAEPAQAPPPPPPASPPPRPAPEPVVEESEAAPTPPVEEAAPVAPPPIAQPEPEPEPEYEEEYSHFAAEPPFRPRRNPLKLWTWAGAIFALLAAATIVSVSYWGLPDWVPVERPTFGAAQADLQLDFPVEEQEIRRLPNGTEFFGASGRVTNIGTETRTVPTILIVLRDSRDAIVYTWEIPPPQATLAPGETITINEAITDVPRRARSAQFGWKPE